MVRELMAFNVQYLDSSFMSILPSRIAAAAISSAVSGLLGLKMRRDVRLVDKLAHFIETDVVCIV